MSQLLMPNCWVVICNNYIEKVFSFGTQWVIVRGER